jgi:hypothetical protein
LLNLEFGVFPADDPGTYSYWIGLYDPTADGNWVDARWEDGSVFNYSNWQPFNTPDNAPGNGWGPQNAVGLIARSGPYTAGPPLYWVDGKWDDLWPIASADLVGICQKKNCLASNSTIPLGPVNNGSALMSDGSETWMHDPSMLRTLTGNYFIYGSGRDQI